MVRLSPLALKDPDGPRGEWRTPPDLFAALDKRFGPFTLDAAATADNALCQRYLTRDSGTAPWPATSRVWCNPPFDETSPFVERGIELLQNGLTGLVCYLLPANRSEQGWWARAVVPVLNGQRNGTVIFLRPRVAYCDARGNVVPGVSFASMVLVLSRFKVDGRCSQWTWR